MKRILTAGLCFVMATVLLVSCGASELDMDTVMGTVSGGVYTNEYADLTFSPTSDWTFYDESELLEMMDLSEDSVDTASKRQNALSRVQTLYTAMAMDEIGANIIIGFENLTMSTDGTSYSAEDYANEIVAQCTASGYTFGDVTAIEIGGNTYYEAIGSVEQSGYDMTQAFLARRIDDYMCFIIITTIDGYTISPDEIIAMLG
ncbi:MAG: efflux RND transporter permease subunit [Oscillospiraceae bacterium]|nr:efflux RND transporter permease subunit [Oscillospiraceae bacterium]